MLNQKELTDTISGNNKNPKPQLQQTIDVRQNDDRPVPVHESSAPGNSHQFTFFQLTDPKNYLLGRTKKTR
jgi:hypothetical protein